MKKNAIFAALPACPAAVLAFALLGGSLAVFPAHAAETVVNEVILVDPDAAPLQPEEVMLIQRSPVPPTRAIDGMPAADTMLRAPDGHYINLEPVTDIDRPQPTQTWDGEGLINPMDMK